MCWGEQWHSSFETILADWPFGRYKRVVHTVFHLRDPGLQGTLISPWRKVFIVADSYKMPRHGAASINWRRVSALRATVMDPAFFILGFPRLFCSNKNHHKFQQQKMTRPWNQPVSPKTLAAGWRWPVRRLHGYVNAWVTWPRQGRPWSDEWKHWWIPGRSRTVTRWLGWMVSHFEIDWMMSLEFFGK